MEGHFMWLGRLKPPIEDIKFGETGPNGSEHMFVFPLKQIKRRESGGIQVDPAQLKAKFIGWIQEKKSLAGSGDVVDVTFFSPATEALRDVPYS